MMDAGATAILGPGLGSECTFMNLNNPSLGFYDFSIFAGTGEIQFGIEGLEPGALVDITVTVELGGQVVGTDTVRVKVSPFVLSNNTLPSADGPDDTVFAATVLAPDLTVLNANLLNTLTSYYGPKANVTAEYDAWLQDGCEIGYVQAPYGQMQVVLDLTRGAAEKVDGHPAVLRQFVQTQMLQANVGIIVLDKPVSPNRFDSGGNIECLPDPSGDSPGFFFYGSGMSDAQTDFFEAQGVNPSLAVNTGWLEVGHVDEVVSLCSDGNHIAVADPEMAIGLMLWAREKNPNATTNPFFDPLGVRTVDYILSQQFGAIYYNENTVMNQQNLPSIVNAVATATGSDRNTWVVERVQGAQQGTLTLNKAKAFTAFLTTTRYYEVRIVDDIDYKYRLYYSDVPNPTDDDWILDPQIGVGGQDCVFSEAKAFILDNWWTRGTKVAGDKYRFSANPGTKIVEIPVLFAAFTGGRAWAMTSNCVNVLVDGSTVFVPETFGPVVDYLGSGTASDILKDYVNSAYEDCCGYEHVEFVEAKWYHTKRGSIHCATNLIRAIPTDKWWQF